MSKTKEYLFVFCLLLSICACKKSDDGEPSPDPVNNPPAEVNKPPNNFTLSTVPDGATEVELKPVLSWSAARDPENDPISYDIILDTNPNPTTVILANTGDTSFEFTDDLPFSETFYWKVIARDDSGNRRESDIYSFTTNALFSLVTDNAGFSGRLGHTSVTFNNKMWVIAGSPSGGSSQNEVWSSSDGITWTQVSVSPTFPPRSVHTSVVFNNNLWVIGGYTNGPSNDVWSSPDGVTWTEVTPAANFPARQSHTTVVFDNKMWAIGGFETNPLGQLADVWNSSDGVTWTQVNTINMPARTHHQTVVFNNKIWLIAGLGENGRTNDVWNSSDGITWELINPSADFDGRYYHSAITFDDKMWVIGGNGFNGSESVHFNDVWSSSDGINWTEETLNAPFSARDHNTLVDFDDSIWVIGGRDDEARLNDVWRMN
jgi:hypothetical protein